jgi:hypothetical protein
MRLSICPKCRAKVSPTDTVCLDCGEDLISLKSDIVEQAKREAQGLSAPPTPAAAVANPAAAGLVAPNELAEDKRLRVFDKQAAARLRQERPAVAVVAAIAFIIALVILAVCANYFKQAQGFVGLKSLTLTEIRGLGLNLIVDPRLMLIVTFMLSLAALLCALGEVLRLLATNTAIAAVDAGETPNIVGMTAPTQAGLMIGAVFAPPAGIILGIFLRFSKDPDTRGVASQMIWAGLIAAALVLVNWGWSLAATALQNSAPKAPALPSQ